MRSFVTKIALKALMMCKSLLPHQIPNFWLRLPYSAQQPSLLIGHYPRYNDELNYCILDTFLKWTNLGIRVRLAGTRPASFFNLLLFCKSVKIEDKGCLEEHKECVVHTNQRLLDKKCSNSLTPSMWTIIRSLRIKKSWW